MTNAPRLTLLIDKDGPLLSPEYQVAQWAGACHRLGLARPYTAELDRLTRGLPRAEGARRVLTELEPGFGGWEEAKRQSRVRELADAKEAVARQMRAARPRHPALQVQDGVGPLLAYWRARRYGLAVASASVAAPEEVALVGLSWAFDEIVVPAPGNPSKEALFRRAIQLMRADPARTIVIEDAPLAIESARRIPGARVIGVCVADSEAELRLAGAHAVVAHPSRITDAVIQQALSAAS